MSEREARGELQDAYMTYNSADFEQNLGWSSDVLPFVKLAEQLGIQNEKMYQDILADMYKNRMHLTFRLMREMYTYIKDKINEIYS